MTAPPPTSLPELHLHLDGSLRRTTLEELAEPLGVEVPAVLEFRAGMGLEAALELFSVTLAVLQTPDRVQRVASEICEDAQACGVSTLEVRFAPQLHRGAAVEEIVDAALSGLERFGELTGEEAGLILCGLYGEDPSVYDRFLEVAVGRPGVVAIDLAGGPQMGHSFSMEHYAPAFTRARDLGLGRTVHAGEGRPPAEIGQAIETLHAQRIGHGTSVLQDPRVTDLVLERGVRLEACPTSNVHTSAIANVEEHPLPRWLDLGIQASINSDNTLFSQVNAASEHQVALGIPGMSQAKLETAIAAGHASRFERR